VNTKPNLNRRDLGLLARSRGSQAICNGKSNPATRLSQFVTRTKSWLSNPLANVALSIRCDVESLRGHYEPTIHTNEHECAASQSVSIGVYLWLHRCLRHGTDESLDCNWAVIRVNLRPFVVQTFLISCAPRGRLGLPFAVVVDGVQ
jgi:hypothetical protein